MNDPTRKAPEDPETAGRAAPADAPRTREDEPRASYRARDEDDGIRVQLGEDPGALEPDDGA
jgi:hypothetical protein